MKTERKLKLPTPEQLDQALEKFRTIYGDGLGDDFSELVKASKMGMLTVKITAARTSSDIYTQTGPTFTLGLAAGYVLAHIVAKEEEA